VLEGLAFDSRNSLEPLLVHSGVEKLRGIYAVGGGTQNRLLMRIKATVLNQAVTVVGVEEATSLRPFGVERAALRRDAHRAGSGSHLTVQCLLSPGLPADLP